ncbi:anti-anti-sigma factor [Streptomyces sp. V4I8]|uniref:STAS domain-containing protein n=1 Tax=Streptomyces sp. V4I8 TaxID=3156469 RepID=UPI003512D0C3
MCGPIAPHPLTVEVVDVGYVVLVRVSGELDTGTAPQLAAALGPLKERHCELDLAWVSFMDSAGLVALLAHQRRARAAWGSLRLVDSSPAVRRILTLTGTTAILLTAPGPAHP